MKKLLIGVGLLLASQMQLVVSQGYKYAAISFVDNQSNHEVDLIGNELKTISVNPTSKRKVYLPFDSEIGILILVGNISRRFEQAENGAVYYGIPLSHESYEMYTSLINNINKIAKKSESWEEFFRPQLIRATEALGQKKRINVKVKDVNNITVTIKKDGTIELS